MNFFQAQDHARRRTLFLLLFSSAGCWRLSLSCMSRFSTLETGLSKEDEWVQLQLDELLLLNTTIGVIGVVLLGSLYKALVLSLGGGKKVAESLGGTLLLRTTQDAEERKLLNIVDEMAIAASAPTPDVYLVPGEAINAFAAGTTPHNAVIGVTRGAVRHLSRDELQGVVAHEFSHIMNGDMRLNIRLIAIVHGIVLISYLGYFCLHRTSPSAVGVGSAIAGLVLIIAGAVGAFVGSLIRAAVSRQREFLADAAAVQYTRNPMGIAGALDTIQRAPAVALSKKKKKKDEDSDEDKAKANAVEFSHMFFSKVASGFSNPFATHPPLKERIARLLPDWPADTPISGQQEESKNASPAPAGADAVKGVSAFAPVAAADMMAQIGTLTPVSLECAHGLLAALSPALLQATEEPYSARALIYALLLDRNNPAVRAAQLQHLDKHADEGVAALTNILWPKMTDLPAAVRLPLVQATFASLHLLSPRQYKLFKDNMAALIAADDSTSLFEWALQALVVHHLQEYFGEKRRARGDEVVSMEYALSILAQSAQGDGAGDAFTSATKQAHLPMTYTKSTFQPSRLLDALQHIAELPPKSKEKFTNAALHCAAHNGQVNADEEALLRAYFMIIGCPLPLLIDGNA